MLHPAIAVFTNESVADILAKGGTGHWVTKAARAENFPYVVCVRNGRHPKSPRDVPHGAAFLIGRISEVTETKTLAANGQPRVLIKFSEYAEIDNDQEVWGKSQNPVWYTDVEMLDIVFTDLQFKPMPPVQIEPEDEAESTEAPENTATILRDAKENLATRLGLPLDAVRITVTA